MFYEMRSYMKYRPQFALILFEYEKIKGAERKTFSIRPPGQKVDPNTHLTDVIDVVVKAKRCLKQDWPADTSRDTTRSSSGVVIVVAFYSKVTWRTFAS